MKNKVVFLDRDGVINIDKGYVYQKKDFIFISGAIEALQYLQSLNYELIVVTNQSGIARGFFEEKDFKSLSKYMLETLESSNILIKDIFFCPHLPNALIKKYDKTCSCRKPKSGMIEDAIKKYNIDRENSILIGDSQRDIEAGKSAKIKSFLFKGDNLYNFVLENIIN